MDVATLIYILLIWTVVGLLAAIAFGKAIRRVNEEEDAP
jgi:hypothetical protein